MELVRSIGEGETERIILHRSLAERFEYKIQIIEDSGIPGLKDARKLLVRIQDNGNTLEFTKKSYSDPTLLVIPLRDIRAIKPIPGESSNIVVRLYFAGDNATSTMLSEVGNTERKSILFRMDRKQIAGLYDQVKYFKDEKINPSIARAIAVAVFF